MCCCESSHDTWVINEHGALLSTVGRRLNSNYAGLNNFKAVAVGQARLHVEMNMAPFAHFRHHPVDVTPWASSAVKER